MSNQNITARFLLTCYCKQGQDKVNLYLDLADKTGLGPCPLPPPSPPRTAARVTAKSKGYKRLITLSQGGLVSCALPMVHPFTGHEVLPDPLPFLPTFPPRMLGHSTLQRLKSTTTTQHKKKTQTQKTPPRQRKAT